MNEPGQTMTAKVPIFELKKQTNKQTKDRWKNKTENRREGEKEKINGVKKEEESRWKISEIDF